MLRIHKRGQAARLLRLGDDLQCDGRLARRLRSIDFEHASTLHSADAQGSV